MGPKMCAKTLVELFAAALCLLTLAHLLGFALFVNFHRLTFWPMWVADGGINDTCTDTVNSTALSHRNLCCKINFLLAVIVVPSSPFNFPQRMGIRNTWGAVARRDDVVLIFLLGQTKNGTLQNEIMEEDALFGDIVQGEFLDSYYNLTLKSIEMLHWVNRHCSNAHFMLKIDDDVFLHDVNFLHYLRQLHGRRESRALIVGLLSKASKPARSMQSKWYISEQEYAPSTYPDFIHGPSYLYTKEAVPLISSAATQLIESRSVIHLEDVFLNGICAEKANVTLVNFRSISVMTVNDVCTVRRLITLHEISPSRMSFLWWLIHDPHFEQCQKVLSTVDSVFYNTLVGHSYSFSK